MKTTKIRHNDTALDVQISNLENLVDELVKESPQETRIRAYMKAAGLPYSEDPIDRLSRVLAALEGARAVGRDRGGETEQNI